VTVINILDPYSRRDRQPDSMPLSRFGGGRGLAPSRGKTNGKQVQFFISHRLFCHPQIVSVSGQRRACHLESYGARHSRVLDVASSAFYFYEIAVHRTPQPPLPTKPNSEAAGKASEYEGFGGVPVHSWHRASHPPGPSVEARFLP
jgi:hypothetical protein